MNSTLYNILNEIGKDFNSQMTNAIMGNKIIVTTSQIPKKDNNMNMKEQYISFIDRNDKFHEPLRNQFGNLSLWQLVINFINSKHNFKLIVKRKEMIEYIHEHMRDMRYSINSIDTYRNYLYKAGYLTYMKKPDGKKKLGWYIPTQSIPCDLSVDDCRNEAYGNIMHNDGTYRVEPRIVWGMDTMYASAGHYQMKDHATWDAELLKEKIKGRKFSLRTKKKKKPKDFIDESEFQV